jgi:perosamine synthetase
MASGRKSIFSDAPVAAAEDYVPIHRLDLSGNERRYLLRCLETTQLSAGDFVLAFEMAFAEASGIRHAISVTSGTTALHLSLHALGIGPGDEVVVPSFTFIATVNAVAQTGATPVFADCDAETWVSEPADIECRIMPRTKAVVVAHLYRAVCNVVAMRELCEARGLILIEDCAQAIGARFRDQHVGWERSASMATRP